MNQASSRTYTHPSFTASCAARFSSHPSSSRNPSSPRHSTPFASDDSRPPSGSAGNVTRRSPAPANGQMRRVSLTPPPLMRNADDLTRDPALRIDEQQASSSRLAVDQSRGDHQADHAYGGDAARQRQSAEEAGSSWNRGEGQRSSFGSSSGVNDDSSSRRRPDLKLALASNGGAGKSEGSERGQDRLPGIAQLDEYLASPWPKPAVPVSTPGRFQGPGDTFRRTRESLPPLGLPGFASSSSSSSAQHSSSWEPSSRQPQAASLPSPAASHASSQLGYEQMERRPSLTQLGRRTSAVLLDRGAPDGRPYARGSLLSPRPAEALTHSQHMARSTSQLENREAMRNFSDQHSSQKRKASFDASPMPSSATVQSMRPHTSGMPPQPFVSHQGRDYDSEPRPRSQGDRWHEDSNKRRREHERWSPERQPASGLPAARESMEEHVRYTGGPSYSAASSNAGSSHERRFYPGEEQQRHAYDREQSQAQRHHVATSSSHPHYLRGDGVDRGYPSGHGLPTSRSYPSPSNRHEQYREEQHGQYGRYPGGPDERDAGSNGGAPNARKRGKLPKAVTDLLKSWLLEHATHPYPTDEEKRRLCAATGLTMSQVSNWFINARRRILVPSPSGGFAVGGTAAAEQVREMFQAEPHHHGNRGQDPRHARPPSPPRYAYHHEQHERYGRR